MATYTLRLLDPAGAYVDTLDVIQSLEYALPANEVGVLTLLLPPLYDVRLFRRDSRIELSRTVGGIVEQRLWLVRRPENLLTMQGAKLLSVTAFDLRDLLRRRVAVEPSQSTKTGAADDLMKEIVTENFVSAFDASRNQPGLSVAADLTLAPIVTMEFAGRRVLDVLRDLAGASLTAGTYLAFDLVPTGSGFEFRTYVDVWGQDRRTTTILSVERGTLVDVNVSSDWTDEATVVYARGRGEGDAALSATATDTVRSAASPFGRIETFLNATNANTTAAVQFAADVALAESVRRSSFTGRLQEQPGTRFGVDLNLGDLVAAEHDGVHYDCRVEPVHITLDETGAETVDVQLRNIE